MKSKRHKPEDLDTSARPAHAAGFPSPSFVIACLLLMHAAGAGAYEAMNLGIPKTRQVYVERLAHRGLVEQAEAWVWAADRGRPLRYDDGQCVYELMYMENDRPVYYTTENGNAAICIATDAVRDRAPYGMRGQGCVIGIWDGGAVRSDHVEFGDRVRICDDADQASHATAVAGTVGAAGLVPAAIGMAPEVRIDSYDWNLDLSELADRAASYAGEPDKIYVSNHSYGTIAGWYWTTTRAGTGWHWYGGLGMVDKFFGQYNTAVNQLDTVAYNAPYLLVFKSAGNDRADNPMDFETVYYFDEETSGWKAARYNKAILPLGDGVNNEGFDTISTCGIAKNIVTVGAVRAAAFNGPRSPADTAMTTFSGWGPADDGRIKPDIVACGFELFTTNNTSARSYKTRSGTSFSCPSASGSAVLLVEYYAKLFPHADTGKLCPGQAMRASTLKGLIIHTADDLGRPGPDYEFGWGLMNTEAAAALLKRHYEEPAASLLAESALHDKDPCDTYRLTTDGTRPIRITLCWTDPPGVATSSLDDRTPCLQNDLDLRVLRPDERTIDYPYTLDPSDPQKDAEPGDNVLDNVEQIDIPATGIPGRYTVTVRCKDYLVGDVQRYSLIASEPLTAEPDPSLE